MTKVLSFFGFYCLGLWLGTRSSWVASWNVFFGFFFLSFLDFRFAVIAALALGSLQSAPHWLPLLKNSERMNSFVHQSFSLLPVRHRLIVVKDQQLKSRYIVRQNCFSNQKLSPCPYFKDTSKQTESRTWLIRMDQAKKWSSLLLGDSSFFNLVEKTLLGRSGIGHLLAVSGLHVAIIFSSVCWVFFLFQMVMTWSFPSFSYLHSFGWLRNFILVAVMILLLYFSGGAASVGRCCLTLASSYLVGFFFPCLSQSKRLSLTLIAAILLSGPAIFDRGFLLSLCAYLMVVLLSQHKLETGKCLSSLCRVVLLQVLLCVICFVIVGSPVALKKIGINLIFMNFWGLIMLFSCVTYWCSWDFGMALVAYFDLYFFRFLAFIQDFSL